MNESQQFPAAPRSTSATLSQRQAQGLAQSLHLTVAATIIATALLQGRVYAQPTDDDAGVADPAAQQPDGLRDDLKDFAAMPLHWRGREWLRFGGLVAVVGTAYHFDDKVHSRFQNNGEANYHEIQDALPAAAVFGGMWLTGKLSDNREARWEADAMRRAVVLSAITVEVVKVATFRERPGPDVTRESWWDGGLSFPSGHTALAFAIGTVLAESGDDRHRAIRRTLGYGIGIGTAYQRLDHDAHWLSDTVAGAAFGIAAARFVMKRRDRPEPRGDLSVVPLDGGAMLTYTIPIRR